MRLPESYTRFLRKQRSGYLYFTLIELLLVIGIIAILATIAIPNILDARCRAKIRALLELLDSIRTDIGSAFSGIGQASAQQMQNILQRLNDAVDIFKEAKAAGCIRKEDKKLANNKIDEMIRTLEQNKPSQEEPVQVIIQRLIDKLRGERFPDSETE